MSTTGGGGDDNPVETWTISNTTLIPLLHFTYKKDSCRQELLDAMKKMVHDVEDFLEEQITEEDNQSKEEAKCQQVFKGAEKHLDKAVNEADAAHEASKGTLTPATAREAANAAQKKYIAVESMDRATQAYAASQAETSAIFKRNITNNREVLELLVDLQRYVTGKRKRAAV